MLKKAAQNASPRLCLLALFSFFSFVFSITEAFAITAQIKLVSNNSNAGTTIDFSTIRPGEISQALHYVEMIYAPNGGEPGLGSLSVFSRNPSWQGSGPNRGGLLRVPNPTERVRVFTFSSETLQPGLTMNAQNEHLWKEMFDINDPTPGDLRFPTYPSGRTYMYFAARSDASTPVASYSAALEIRNYPLEILTQPASQIIPQTLPVTFHVVAQGYGNLSYQWQRDRVDIAGATNSDYIITSTAFRDDGARFRCRVSDGVEQLYTDEATLTVLAPPTITLQPQSQSVLEAQPVTFTVGANGTPPLRYQWFRNRQIMPGQTSSTLNINSAAASDNGAKYGCVVTNLFEQPVASQEATLTVNVPARIVTHPQSQAINLGSPVTFSVTASGTPSLRYKWFRNGAEISGVTTPSYTINSVGLGDDGVRFTCEARNDFGFEVSLPATLRVNSTGQLPFILTQPQSQDITEGNSVTFRVEAGGEAPLSYQWYRNGGSIGGAQASVYIFNSVALANDGDRFMCRVSNRLGQVDSAEAVLRVFSRPRIETHPTSQVIREGNPVTFRILAAGGASPLQYEWQVNGQPIPGETSNTLLISQVLAIYDQLQFRCKVTDRLGATILSQAATLTVISPVTFRAQPQSQTVSEGSPVQFRVEVAGTAPFTYQWFKNRQEITGANSANFTIPSVTPGDSGRYGCVVSNVLGPVPSTEATLTVIQGPLYNLTVINGSGSGRYQQGAIVEIQADAPGSGRVFDRWTGAMVANPMTPSTTITMPAGNAIVTATYRDVGGNVETVTSNGFGIFDRVLNPKNGPLQIHYQMLNPGDVQISLYDRKGEELNKLVSEYKSSGKHTVEWNGRTDSGSPMAPNLYLLVMTINGEIYRAKVVLVR